MPGRGISTLRATDAGQHKYDGGVHSGQPGCEISERALFGRVRRRTVMIQAIRPVLHTTCREVEFRWVQIPGGRIHAQSVLGASRRDALGCANRGGIKQELRKKCRVIVRNGPADPP